MSETDASEETRLIRSEVFPGSAQQFRAQMQRLYDKCVIHFWPPAIEEQFLVRQKRGRWESSGGDRLVFREERQLEPAQVSGPMLEDTSFERDESEKRADITPETRTTWSVLMLPRIERYTEIPQPEPRGMITLKTVALDGEISKVEYDVRLKEQGFAGIEAYERPGGTTQVDLLDGYDPVSAWEWGLAPTLPPIGPPFVEFCDFLLREVWGNAGLPVPDTNEEDEAAGLWLKVEDYRWDRQAVRLLHLGYSSEEIARQVGRTPKTVDNRFSVLRGIYGTDVIPYRKQGPRKIG